MQIYRATRCYSSRAGRSLNVPTHRRSFSSLSIPARVESAADASGRRYVTLVSPQLSSLWAHEAIAPISPFWQSTSPLLCCDVLYCICCRTLSADPEHVGARPARAERRAPRPLHHRLHVLHGRSLLGRIRGQHVARIGRRAHRTRGHRLRRHPATRCRRLVFESHAQSRRWYFSISHSIL